MRLHTAASMSQNAGVLALPVFSTRKVHAIGVIPPKIAAARLNAKEANGTYTFWHHFGKCCDHSAVVHTKEEREVSKGNK